MNCKEARDLIAQYLDREMTQENVQDALAHMERCRPCFTDFEVHQIIQKIIRLYAQSRRLQEPVKEKMVTSLHRDCP